MRPVDMIFNDFLARYSMVDDQSTKKKKTLRTTIFVIVSESATICLLKYLFKTKQN